MYHPMTHNLEIISKISMHRVACLTCQPLLGTVLQCEPKKDNNALEKGKKKHQGNPRMCILYGSEAKQ